MNIGFLHPGAMGVSLAASAQNSGHSAYWASAGRSPETRARAHAHQLKDAHTIEELCATCSTIVSICPPHAAERIANQVLDCSFKGLYLDANAIAPQRAIKIGQMMEQAGISFVDGSIIGGPAWKAGETRLYLSGAQAERAAVCFSSGPLETEVIGEETGKASALKMCYSAFTKGSTALLCAILAAAEQLDVREALAKEWARDGSGFAQEAEARVRGTTAKAWRFEGEMMEIAATFGNAGMPEGFHAAASEIYRRIAHFKGAPETPALEDVLQALVQNGKNSG